MRIHQKKKERITGQPFKLTLTQKSSKINSKPSLKRYQKDHNP
jgi:hypothetical protein